MGYGQHSLCEWRLVSHLIDLVGALLRKVSRDLQGAGLRRASDDYQALADISLATYKSILTILHGYIALALIFREYIA